jgi:glycosyltransferase involved in cell wall biosynthesis
MMKPFTIITPTGDRPEAFALCWKYVNRQTIWPAEWIIVDDGVTGWQDIPLSNIPTKVIRRVRGPNDPAHTLPVQMLEALLHVTTDYVLIFEDDDWYREDYCERMMKMFDSHPNAQLIGQGQAIYYHVPMARIMRMKNADRASLCQTGFRSSLIPSVNEACFHATDPFIDLKLWYALKVSEKFLLLDQPRMCVGIKGLPGRQNSKTIGINWQHPSYKPDPDGSQFQELIGNDVNDYKCFRTLPDVPPRGENQVCVEPGALNRMLKGSGI